jgi:hypothetical protein
MNGYKREAWEGFETTTDVQTQGAIVCHFLAREIKTVKDCINEAYEKTGSMENDKHLLASLIESYNWIADVTENEDLRDMILDDKRTFTVTLSEDEFISLANLSVTLHENLDALKKVPDFEGDMSVGELLEECFFPALEHLLTQLDW